MPETFDWLLWKTGEDLPFDALFEPEISLHYGALLLQILLEEFEVPETFDWLLWKTGEELPFDALFEPEISLRYGALLLRILLDEFELTPTAVAAYHAGRGRVNQWLRDPDVSPDGRVLAHIPSNDTRHYVNKVMRAYARYEEIILERQAEDD